MGRWTHVGDHQSPIGFPWNSNLALGLQTRPSRKSFKTLWLLRILRDMLGSWIYFGFAWCFNTRRTTNQVARNHLKPCGFCIPCECCMMGRWGHVGNHQSPIGFHWYFNLALELQTRPSQNHLKHCGFCISCVIGWDHWFLLGLLGVSILAEPPT